ncbi:MAG: hypothetical protein L6R36_009236 [Xanthoria steineri]|nr:MAG: hypothetical protein L6R36_009236 [Xanthoria steineri]
MDSILHGLNNAQLAAVTSPADVVQILAPPGSGKTKTLTARVAYLIRHYNYKPWNILCLTFTIKSSREMKERLAKLIGNGMEAKLVLGTFHSVCRRYLVSYGHLIGLRKDFGIADSSDSLSIIKRILNRLRFSLDPKAAQFRISSCKSKGVCVAKLADDASKNKKADQQEFAQVFEAYEDQLDRGNLLDYDDLLIRCCDLLRQHPLCVSNVEAVLIDEFQDTNLVQFDLMRLFAAQRKRVTTVGDPDQSIYGWRSAEIKNLARMQTQYPETLVIHLQDNYRSSGAILLAAQELIQQDESRPSKSLLPTHCPGTLPVLRRLPSSDTEALWIVTEISRLIGMTGRMLSHPDIAILLRSAALSRQIESAMGRAGIPYRMVGGQRFFDRVEIKILLDYLRVVSQPTNNDAVARVVNIPARGVGAITTKALLEEAETKKVTLWSLILDAIRGHVKPSAKISKPAEKGLGAFVDIILTAKQKLKEPLDPLSPQSLLQFVIKKLNFQEYIKRSYENDSEGRWANVEELISQAGEYLIPSNSSVAESEAENSTSLPIIEGIAQIEGDAGEEMLSMFLANVALATELQKDDGSEDGQGQSQVTISTIHAAKGLEWPVVFVPAAYEGSIPHSRAEDTDEERRLLYVAMTRAQALLYISCPTRNSRGEESTLSQFLDPKTLGHYLVNVGPHINTGFVSDVARILKRNCPLESKMVEESLKLESRQDDLWSLDGQESPEQLKSRWDNKTSNATPYGYQQMNQRPAIGPLVGGYATNRCTVNITTISGSPITVGSATTMDNASSFSIHQLGGFTSATKQMEKDHHLRENDTKRMAGRSPQAVEGAQKPASGKRKAQDDAQSSLTKLWGRKRRSTELDTLTETSVRTHPTSLDSRHPPISVKSSNRIPSSSHTTASVGSGSPVRPHTNKVTLPRAPLAGIPENLAKHRFQRSITPRPRLPAMESTESDRPYAFLSSSPPFSETANQGQAVAAGLKSHEVNKRTEAIESLKENALLQDDMRPAVTAHTTSLAHLQATTTSRKTLGVRRSMNGWNAGRSGQGFSVPRRKEW